MNAVWDVRQIDNPSDGFNVAEKFCIPAENPNHCDKGQQPKLAGATEDILRQTLNELVHVSYALSSMSKLNTFICICITARNIDMFIP